MRFNACLSGDYHHGTIITAIFLEFEVVNVTRFSLFPRVHRQHTLFTFNRQLHTLYVQNCTRFLYEITGFQQFVYKNAVSAVISAVSIICCFSCREPSMYANQHNTQCAQSWRDGYIFMRLSAHARVWDCLSLFLLSLHSLCRLVLFVCPSLPKSVSISLMWLCLSVTIFLYVMCPCMCLFNHVRPSHCLDFPSLFHIVIERFII